eukprot:1757166-Rhodomonas_salina.1
MQCYGNAVIADEMIVKRKFTATATNFMLKNHWQIQVPGSPAPGLPQSQQSESDSPMSIRPPLAGLPPRARPPGRPAAQPPCSPS